MRTTIDSHSEVVILARLFGNEEGRLPSPMARYLLNLGFNDSEKARMHELAELNQAGRLSALEKKELLAYAKAGSLLSLLKSRARRALGIKPKKSRLS